MAFMVWNDRLSVGVKVIDDDHKILLNFANELYDAILAKRSKEVLGDIVDGLVDYTTLHFAREEQFFSDTDYQYAAEHKRQHDDMKQEILRIQVQYKSGAPALTLEVMNFLKDWLYDHILGSDAKYEQHLNSLGIH
jgi:hemerythrin